ncbi:MAG: 2Fe-2S iron-sulfur cluster binding domain-containing protein [Planctomycetes bacterium]|nr:2Fe-2S iron-sulfur cluster binding domain-containing protein [Planctomycetota bacterium]
MSEPLKIPCVVAFARLGREVEVAAGELLLEVLEQAGVAIASLCRGGSCGTCRVRLLAGAPVIESRHGLRQDQREDGWILTCCARTVPGQRIVLDL